MRLLLLFFASALGACGSSASAPPAPATSPFPSDTISIAQGGRGGFILSYVRSAAESAHVPLPACFDELTGRLAAQYQLELGPGQAAAHVFDGSFDRDAVEACVPELDAVFGGLVHFRIERRGELTRLVQQDPKETRAAWIAWSPRRVVVTGDEALARSVLANPHPLAADAPLAQLWAKTEGGDMRVASVRDLTSRFLGVPSTGFTVSLRAADAKLAKQAFARVQFATEHDAEAAQAALGAAASRGPEVARVVELLRARREGRELVVDVGAFMREPNGLALLQDALGMP